MIRHNGKNWIPAGVKPLLGRRRGAPVNGRPKARWIAGWVGGFGEPSDPTACDFTFSPIFPPSPTPTSTVTPTVTPTSSITPTPTVTPTATVTPTPSTSVPSGDPDATAYLADVVASGGTINATITSAVQTLFTDLKSNGLYSKLDVFYPMVGGVAASHSINAKLNKTYDITWYGGMTHGVSGTTGNGSNSYGDTFYNPSTNLSLGSRTWALYSWYEAPGPSAYDLSVRENGIICGFNNTNYYGLFNATSYSPVNVGTTKGCYVASENSLNSQNMFHNGSSVITTTKNSNAYNGNMYVGAANNLPSAGAISARGYNFVGIGEGLTSTQQGILSTIINDYQTSLGRNTY